MADPGAVASSSRKPPTFRRALVSGAISGLAVDFILFPLDTIKTRLQSRQGFLKSGGFKGVYAGVGSVGLGSAPGAAAFFTTYETLKAELPSLVPLFERSPTTNHLVSSVGAEFISCLIRVPTEVVKSRTQAGTYGQGTGSIASAFATARFEGAKGFYRGFGITIGREIPFTAIQFPLYEYLKTQLSVNYLGGRRPTSEQAAACGSVAGATAAALTTPLDVVKTRVMLEARTSATPGRTEASPSVLSFGPRLVTLFRDEGVHALFRGWQPRVLAIAFGGAVFLGIYDFAVNFGKENQPVEEVR